MTDRVGESERLGILVGGGPAPGINSTIAAATIEAINSGLEVIGIYDGFEHLINGDKGGVRSLTIEDVSRIHFQGGSILRTSRANLIAKPQNLVRSVQTLQELGISLLMTIGGDGTGQGAMELARAAQGALRIAHVPKTIDNDLPLPGGTPSFGFETARHEGTAQVLNLMEESRTTNRWFFVEVMGRKAGHLALGIGKASGATVTVIPEEFGHGRVSLDTICAVLQGAILKRRVMGRQYGVAIIAEGIAEQLDPAELSRVPGVEVTHDPTGNIRLGEIPLATILRREVVRRFAAQGEQVGIVDVSLGYVLRAARPIPFDIDYTRTLGYGAVQFLLSAPEEEALRTGGMVYLKDGYLAALPLQELQDPVTKRARIRLVDLNSLSYEVATQYMIRLTSQDLRDPSMLAKLAEACTMAPEEFSRTFASAVVARP